MDQLPHNVEPNANAELWELASRSCNDELRSEDVARLENLLTDNPQAKQFYGFYMLMHAELAWRFRGCRDNDGNANDLEDGEFTPHSPLSLHSPLSTTHYPLPTSFIGGPVFSYMVATVVLCLMLLGAWAYKISLVRPEETQTAQNERGSNLPATEYVGRVTGMKDCRWANEDTQTVVGASVSLDRQYALASGLLEITYKTGARVILEGPCTYKVESSAGGFLERGKLTARVETKSEVGSRKSEESVHHSNSAFRLPPSAFAVRTPTAIVTDLGTEFGVEVDKNGNTTPHVFQGSVRVEAASDAGPASGAQEVILRENESARVDKTGDNKQRVVKIDTGNASRFVRNIPAASGVANAYAELILSFNPVVYYRMEWPANDKDTDKVIDSSGNGLHAILKLGNQYGSPYHAGRWGDALWFRGPMVVDAVHVPDYPKATEDKLTVSAWVTAERWMARWPKIVANWGRRPIGQFNFGLFEEDYDLSARVMQRDGTRVTVREGRPFPYSQWQHVAFTVDGAVLRLYRNGVEVGRTECRGIDANPQLKSLVIGSKTFDDGEQIVPGYCWRGMIDELAVFNEALTPEDIRRLYEGKPSPAKKQKEVENMEKR